MVHALTAIRKRKSLILDTCDIFVKEPLLDWFKDARQRNNQQGGADLDEERALSWYPRAKIAVVKQKLLGVNPVRILAKELRESRHGSRTEYITNLLQAIQGHEDSIRVAHLRSRAQYLSASDQVDVLIEQARDSNILGRTWSGWCPYI